MEQDTCQQHVSHIYPDFTTYLEASNLPPTHQESTNQPLAQELPQSPSDSQYGYTPDLIYPWPFQLEQGQWAPQNMAWDPVASQPPTTEPAMETSSQATPALCKQGGLDNTCDSQYFLPCLLTSPEQSYELMESLGFSVEGMMAALPIQSETTPLMPSFTGQDETVGLSTQGEPVTAEGQSQEDYNDTGDPEAEIAGPQKHVGAVEKLCQLEGRLQYLNKQQMSLVKDSF
ncbi:hypothetical protein ACJ41O_015099 [Fusarium nematophilum]